MTNRDGDLHTVLRHLVNQTQWGGNQGEKIEATEALDRLTSGNQGKDGQPAADEKNKEPDVGGGTRTGSAKATSGTVKR